ncbi:hypothetical protein JJJ17_11605 [Paracoccus caeni]|uniref:DUF4148 domain-containing protein n=1 Tax=Paracoccus caeni TaxID=657651 RepID=A0A934W0Q1_9RHOB|nr:hypothetical protein [Paracoccus caeni]MBK4216573.1 hypothetical protein [Paracoccus caeni]
MKRFAIALTALSLVAGAASATNFGGTNESPDLPVRSFEAAKTVSVDAGTVMSPRELNRAGLKADAKVKVSDFSSSAVPSTYER